MDNVKLWKRVFAMKKGLMTSRKTIKTFAKRCGYAYDTILQMDVETALEHLKDAYKDKGRTNICLTTGEKNSKTL